MLRFDNVTPDTIYNACKHLIKLNKDAHNKVASLKGDKTFETVVRPLINATDEGTNEFCLVQNMSSFHPNKEVRNASVECKKTLADLEVECNMRQDTYHVFKEYYDTVFNKEEKLTYEEKRYVEKMMRRYKRDGLHINNLDIKNLMKKINELCIQFTNNINEENTTFVRSKKELTGLPESWFNTDKLAGDQMYTITLKYPDYFPIMKFCDNEDIRKQMYIAFSSRCKAVNGPLLDEIVFLRDKMARLLGYNCYADYALEIKMAKNTANVMKFLDGLCDGFTILIKKEFHELTNFARSICKDPNYELKKWDLQYYTRLYKESKCNINISELRQYFPLPHVVMGMLKLYERLLSLKFVHIETDNVWHKSVKLYHVINSNDNKLIGMFYLDMYPREGKYGHAAIFPFVTGSNHRLPVATMACNFPEHECLLFDDTVTLFHEFGHVMHHICSKTQLSEFSGFSVEGDFVEAPSQMLEYWCYEVDALKYLSSHKDTGQPLPIDYIKKLDDMDKLDAGFFNMRQLVFGKFDMLLHSRNYDNISDVNSLKLFNELDKIMTLIASPDGTNFSASFGHLVNGYEAGYYGYLMSEVYACDMFTKFKGHVTDPVLGAEYRSKILEPGSSKDAIDLLKDFLGREPNNEAFLLDKGLTN